MGSLYLSTRRGAIGTEIDNVRFTAPFKLTSPFYIGTTAEIMIMQASAGLLKGDEHEIEISVSPGTSAVITEQSYTKIFKTDDGYASKRVKISVGKDAVLYYLPCPSIPFSGSSFSSLTEIELAPGSRLMFWDILAGGRVGMDELFRFNRYCSSTRVRLKGKLVYADSSRLVPAEHDLSSIGCFEGCTHMGTAYFYGFENDFEFNETDGIISAYTQPAEGILVRALADSGDKLTAYFKSLLPHSEILPHI